MELSSGLTTEKGTPTDSNGMPFYFDLYLFDSLSLDLKPEKVLAKKLLILSL